MHATALVTPAFFVVQRRLRFLRGKCGAVAVLRFRGQNYVQCVQRDTKRAGEPLRLMFAVREASKNIQECEEPFNTRSGARVMRIELFFCFWKLLLPSRVLKRNKTMRAALIT